MVLNVAFKLDVFVIRVFQVHILLVSIFDDELVKAEEPHVVDVA